MGTGLVVLIAENDRDMRGYVRRCVEKHGLEIEAIIEARSQAKADKDFVTADALRDKLAAAGIRIEDGPDGTTWRRE